jgi:hypothetical protein
VLFQNRVQRLRDRNDALACGALGCNGRGRPVAANGLADNARGIP